MNPTIINSICITVLSITIIILCITIYLQGQRITMLSETMNGLIRDMMQTIIGQHNRRIADDDYPDITDPDDAEAYQLDLDLER